MTINSAITQAVGKWDSIYQSLNIDVFPKNKHKPCPACGGSDRFRYDDKNGKGDFICNQCGSGDGINLIERVNHCTTKDAIKMIADCLNLNANHNKTTDNTAVSQMRDSPVCKKVEYLLSQSKLGQSEYLTKKGLDFELPLLDEGKIIVPLLNIKGEYTGAQFIEVDGSKHLMKGSNKKGAFIIVRPQFEDVSKATEIVICEGLATGITMAEIRHHSCIIAAIDAGNLIHVARSIREVNPTTKIIIAGDNDAGADKNVGKDKAIEAAKAVNGYYSIPDTDYKCDWDDYRQKLGIDKTKQDFDKSIKKAIEQDLSLSENYAIMHSSKQKAIPDLSQMQASQKADVLIDHYDNNLALDMVTNEVYQYKDNVWQIISEIDLKRELVQLFRQSNAHYSEKGIKSTIDTMKLQVPLKGEPARNLIGFNNGVFDLDTRLFKSHSKNHWLQSINNVDFINSVSDENIEHHAPNFYQWLSRSAKSSTIKMDAIKAALFMVLANRYDWQLFLEVTGAGGSGKSIFAEIATMLAGKNNTVSANMEALEKPRERSLIVGQSLIILPDQARYIGEGNGIKAITGGDDVAIDEKYKKPYSTKIQGVVLAINNNPMTFSNDDGGISRRRVIFHFGEVIPANERDPKLKDKIRAELSVIIRHLFNYFDDDSKAKSLLIQQQKSSEAIEIKRQTNPLIDFCSYLTATNKPDGMMIGKYSTPIQFKRFLYHAYITFIENNNLKNPLSLRNFVSALPQAMKEYDIEVIIRARHSEGRRTNLHLDYEKCNDWFPDAALEENNIKQK